MTIATTGTDWLKDTTRTNPQVIAHLDAENAATDAALAPLADLQHTLLREFISRVKTDVKTAEIVDGSYAYYTELDADASQPRHMRRHLDTGNIETLLDEHTAAQGGYFAVGDIGVSDDHALLGWTEDRDGSERYTLFIRNISTGETLGTLGDIAASFEFNKTGTKIAYVAKDDAEREYQVWAYDIPTGQSTLLYEETDARYGVSIHTSRDENWLIITSTSQVPTTETVIVERTHFSSPTTFARRVDGVAAHVDAYDNQFWILTNHNRRDFRIATGMPGQTPSEWEAVYTPSDGITLADMTLFANHIAIEARYKGFNRVAVAHRNGSYISDITWLGDITAATTTELDENPDPLSRHLRVSTTDWTTPDTEILYTLSLTGTPATDPIIDWVHPTPNYDQTQYESFLNWATSEDGTEVPYSVIRRKNIETRGTQLWAYGSYGVSEDPGLVSTWVSLLDRGIACVVAYPRGGGELGRAWHDNGKLEHKENTFKDMEAVSRALVRDGYAPIVIRGGSAGGLMVGATINRAPELFAGAVAEVPFVDCLATMLDPTLPLTIGEYDEWGNPEEPDVYDRIQAYSPVDNIREADYPAIYATAGFHDPRVGYWEPAKWVIAIRENTTSGRPVLFRCNMNGHGGSTGRWDAYAERAEAMAFVIDRIERAHS